ncbi:uncharacterized protein TNCV_4068481 [Trichonephila clavipes]|nr:uncharacterized protein TNCV_4068481 [Trichonephila clavipes]
MSSFLGFCEWNTRNRRQGDRRKKKKSEREKEEKRARKREGRIVGGRGEENPRVLLGDADQESETRMRKNALRTGRRQAVELRKGDLLEVARELGVEVNGDQTKVEIKDMILRNDKNDMETIKAVMEGILEEKEREFEERRQIREFEINDLANVCILSGKRTVEVSERVNKCRPLINPVVNKRVENATSCDFEKKNCDPPVRCTNVSHPSEVGRKEFNVNRSSDCDVEMKVGVCEGRVKTVAMGAQRVINLDNIGDGSFELKRDKGVANPEGLICENSCEEKYTLGTLMGCEKQLTVNRESFRNHTIAKIAGPLKVKENTCKADGRACLEDGLAMRYPLSEPREIYKDSLATDNRSNIGSEFTFEIDLPGKRDRSTIYRLNLIKL